MPEEGWEVSTDRAAPNVYQYDTALHLYGVNRGPGMNKISFCAQCLLTCQIVEHVSTEPEAQAVLITTLCRRRDDVQCVADSGPAQIRALYLAAGQHGLLDVD